MTVDEVIADEFRKMGYSDEQVAEIKKVANLHCAGLIQSGKAVISVKDEEELRRVFRLGVRWYNADKDAFERYIEGGVAKVNAEN